MPSIYEVAPGSCNWEPWDTCEIRIPLTRVPQSYTAAATAVRPRLGQGIASSTSDLSLYGVLSRVPALYRGARGFCLGCHWLLPLSSEPLASSSSNHAPTAFVICQVVHRIFFLHSIYPTNVCLSHTRPVQATQRTAIRHDLDPLEPLETATSLESSLSLSISYQFSTPGQKFWLSQSHFQHSLALVV